VATRSEALTLSEPSNTWNPGVDPACICALQLRRSVNTLDAAMQCRRFYRMSTRLSVSELVLNFGKPEGLSISANNSLIVLCIIIHVIYCTMGNAVA
jgi:hypothetical protein